MEMADVQNILLVGMALFCPGSLIITLILGFIVVRQAGWLKTTEVLYLEGLEESAVKPTIIPLIKAGWTVSGWSRSETVGTYNVLIVKERQRVIG